MINHSKISHASRQRACYESDDDSSRENKMANVQPGTYRIVNLARNKAIRVPDEDPDTIASWHSQDEANQKVRYYNNIRPWGH
jgi:hypothetical protein